MIVTSANLHEVVCRLALERDLGCDCETTGLAQSDEIFSLIFTTAAEVFYLNFNRWNPDGAEILEKQTTYAALAPIFSDPNRIWRGSNFKFDLRMLRKDGVEVAGEIHCTEAVERLVRNDYLKYGLAACAERRGLAKSDAVAEYVASNGLTSKVIAPGKKTPKKLMHYERVMQPYAELDAHLSRTIAHDQMRELALVTVEEGHELPSRLPLLATERHLTKTLSRMEGDGIKIDLVRCQAAFDYEMGRVEAGKRAYEEFVGCPFVSSGKSLGPVFDKFGVAYERTEKGNPSFTADWLDELPDTTPLGSLINGIRRPEKRAGTYYGSYLHLATDLNRIHCDFKQGGTSSGRLSARDPNLTNIPKEDEPEDLEIPFHVRECFIPDDGYFFLDIDWAQIQYRIMADRAGEKGLIDAIMAGEDTHEATARLCGITRKQAKTLNFALLFGAGGEKVAGMLGITYREAKMLINVYFGKLQAIEKWTKAVARSGETRGFVFNPYGRRLYIEDRNYAYKLPCHIIQGTEGDTLKASMVRIDELFKKRKARSRMTLPVHDEILFNWHPNELDLIPDVVKIMESVYDPYAINGMKLTTSVEYATERFGKRHLKKGIPDGTHYAPREVSQNLHH
jgi:DNA polymerase-1